MHARALCTRRLDVEAGNGKGVIKAILDETIRVLTALGTLLMSFTFMAVWLGA
jgi:hypothetical protein